MPRALRAVPVALVLVFSLFAFFTPATDEPPVIDIWDKLGHALIFAALAVTGRLAGAGARRLFVVLLGYGVLVEVLQGVLPIGREGDWHDVVADLVGLAGGLVLTALAVLVVRAAPAPEVRISGPTERPAGDAPGDRFRSRRPG